MPSLNFIYQYHEEDFKDMSLILVVERKDLLKTLESFPYPPEWKFIPEGLDRPYSNFKDWYIP